MIVYRATALIFFCVQYWWAVPVQGQWLMIHPQARRSSTASNRPPCHENEPHRHLAALTEKLTASDATAFDLFGRSVALSGDTAIVGAFGDDEESGSAYVFVRDGKTWVEQQKLTASDAASGDYFGHAVALSGDTAIIGAYADGGDYSGSAYVFVRDGTTSTWTEQQKLTASDAASGDYFGISVALSGDAAIVGAQQGGFIGNNGSGAAYIFAREGTTWTEQQKLTASDATSGNDFGRSVALSGNTAIVGAYLDDDGARQSGSAYVFAREGMTWTEQQKLMASDAAVNDRFGSSVALSGDTTIVGAWGDDNYSGSAYVFTRDKTTSSWTQQQKLTASDAVEFNLFGISVTLSGNTAIVGALSDEDGVVGAGSAYVFVRDGTTSTWMEQQKLAASDAAGDHYFGKCVALSGDTIIVGAEGDDDGGHKSGSVYVVSFDNSDECLAREQ